MAFDPALLLVQALNGLQLGVLLFLVAAGLTLVFGILDVINLAHGAQYMAGAYFAATFAALTGSFLIGAALALAAALALGLLLEALVLRHLYARGHLEQVLATFGLILVLNESVRLIWGTAPLPFAPPAALDFAVEVLPGVAYPAWRLAILAAGLAVALGLALLVGFTRFGMLVRACASNPAMLEGLGVDTRALARAVVALGAVLAGLAGLMAGPIAAVQPGMGDGVLILAFVTTVTGGLGSVRGAFAGALLVGLVDTAGRSFLVDALKLALPPAAATTAGPAFASMAIYLLMAAVLVFRPAGLLPAPGRDR